MSDELTHSTAGATTVKNIVLVHGAFADGSSWAKVIVLLQQMGYRNKSSSQNLNWPREQANASDTPLAQDDSSPG